MTLHGVSLKSNSHLFYIHGVMFQASGKFHPFSIEFACIPLLSYLYTRRLRRNYLSMKATEFPILLRYVSKDLMTKYTKLTR